MQCGYLCAGGRWPEGARILPFGLMTGKWQVGQGKANGGGGRAAGGPVSLASFPIYLASAAVSLP